MGVSEDVTVWGCWGVVGVGVCEEVRETNFNHRTN